MLNHLTTAIRFLIFLISQIYTKLPSKIVGQIEFIEIIIQKRTKKLQQNLEKPRGREQDEKSFPIIFSPDGRHSGISAVDAVDRSGSVAENGLLNRNSFGIAVDGVWWDRSVLVRIMSDIERNSDDRFICLRHFSTSSFSSSSFPIKLFKANLRD